jgi:hypothetical protein
VPGGGGGFPMTRASWLIKGAAVGGRTVERGRVGADEDVTRGAVVALELGGTVGLVLALTVVIGLGG